MGETHEKFVALAALHDEATRGTRTSGDLARDLRAAEEVKKDPNFESHLGGFMKAGSAERPDYDLPSTLRLLKYKHSVGVKRLAASELREKNPQLSEELAEIADEMEESHQRFMEMAERIKHLKYFKNGTLAR